MKMMKPLKIGLLLVGVLMVGTLLTLRVTGLAPGTSQCRGIRQSQPVGQAGIVVDGGGCP